VFLKKKSKKFDVPTNSMLLTQMVGFLFQKCFKINHLNVMPIILTSTENKKIDCDHNVFIHIGNWLKMGWISNFLTIRKELV
jgi:hypothetical protein